MNSIALEPVRMQRGVDPTRVLAIVSTLIADFRSPQSTDTFWKKFPDFSGCCALQCQLIPSVLCDQGEFGGVASSTGKSTFRPGFPGS